jgi:hypothetical protein
MSRNNIANETTILNEQERKEVKVRGGDFLHAVTTNGDIDMKKKQKLILICAVFFLNIAHANQVDWTRENCLRVRSLSQGSADYLNGLVGNWSIKYPQPKMVHSQNRLGCFIHLNTPNTPYTCTTSGLYSDGKDTWAAVDQCAPSGNFSF